MRIHHELHEILERLKKMAKELDDLNAAIDKLTIAVDAVVARPVPTAGVDPVAVEAAATKIIELSDKLSAPPAA